METLLGVCVHYPLNNRLYKLCSNVSREDFIKYYFLLYYPSHLTRLIR